MLTMIGKRLMFAIPSLIGVVIVTFLLTRALPGDPAAYFAGPMALVPLALYALLVVLQVLALMPSGGIVRSLCAWPLIVLTHLLYGFGFWVGLFTKLKSPGEKSNVSVKLEKIAIG